MLPLLLESLFKLARGIVEEGDFLVLAVVDQNYGLNRVCIGKNKVIHDGLVPQKVVRGAGRAGTGQGVH